MLPPSGEGRTFSDSESKKALYDWIMDEQEERLKLVQAWLEARGVEPDVPRLLMTAEMEGYRQAALRELSGAR